MWRDFISYITYTDDVPNFEFGPYTFHPTTIRRLVDISNLGINIDDATLDEFILTAQNDYSDYDISTLRLRNPATNRGFTRTELTTIWRNISRHESNSIHAERIRRVASSS